MSSLYHLTAELQQLLSLDSYSDEELQKLDSVYEDFQDKCIAVATVIKEMEARQKAIADAMFEMEDKAIKLNNKVHYLKDYLKDSMVKANLNKIDKSPYFDIKVKNNPEKLYVNPAIVLSNEWYVKNETYRLDVKLVKDALNRGIEIPGAELVKDKRIEIK